MKIQSVETTRLIESFRQLTTTPAFLIRFLAQPSLWKKAYDPIKMKFSDFLYTIPHAASPLDTLIAIYDFYEHERFNYDSIVLEQIERKLFNALMEKNYYNINSLYTKNMLESPISRQLTFYMTHLKNELGYTGAANELMLTTYTCG